MKNLEKEREELLKIIEVQNNIIDEQSRTILDLKENVSRYERLMRDYNEKN